MAINTDELARYAQDVLDYNKRGTIRNEALPPNGGSITASLNRRARHLGLPSQYADSEDDSQYADVEDDQPQDIPAEDEAQQSEGRFWKFYMIVIFYVYALSLTYTMCCKFYNTVFNAKDVMMTGYGRFMNWTTQD